MSQLQTSFGARGQQLGRRVVRAPHLIAPLFDFVRGVEEAIHRARRAQVGALIEQGGVDLRRRLIDEARVEQMLAGRRECGRLQEDTLPTVHIAVDDFRSRDNPSTDAEHGRARSGS